MILALAGSLELFFFDRALLGFHRLKQALIIAIRLLNPSHESTLPNHDLYDEDPGSCGDPNSLLLLSLTSFTIFPLYTWTTQLILATSWYAIRTECRLRPSFPPPAMHFKTSHSSPSGCLLLWSCRCLLLSSSISSNAIARKLIQMKLLLPLGLLSLNGSPLMKYLATLSLFYPICNPQCCNRKKETIPHVPICYLLLKLFQLIRKV